MGVEVRVGVEVEVRVDVGVGMRVEVGVGMRVEMGVELRVEVGVVVVFCSSVFYIPTNKYIHIYISIINYY